MHFAQYKGIAGIVVVNGCIRDLDALRGDEIKIQIYAAGVTPQAPFKNGPEEN